MGQVRRTFDMFLTFLYQRWVIWLLFYINLAGTVYGYIWYVQTGQLGSTPLHFIIFVPDSPTASAFFTLALGFYLFYGRNRLVEALAAITSFKYGIWAIAAIFAGAWFEHADPTASLMLSSVRPLDWMLVLSHGAMALEVLLFARLFSFNTKYLMIAAAWTLLNDFIDYVFDMHPWLSSSISDYDHIVGYATVGLSLLTIFIFYKSISWQYKK